LPSSSYCWHCRKEEIVFLLDFNTLLRKTVLLLGIYHGDPVENIQADKELASCYEIRNGRRLLSGTYYHVCIAFDVDDNFLIFY